MTNLTQRQQAKEQDRPLLINLARQNLSQEQIAEALGRTTKAVNVYMAREGLSLRYLSGSTFQLDTDKVHELIAKRYTTSEIAKKLGTSASNLRGHLYRAGISVRRIRALAKAREESIQEQSSWTS